MVCDTRILEGETKQTREKGIKDAIARLEAALKAGTVQVELSKDGALAFKGWTDASRNRVSDTCAYRKLSVANSWALKQAVARAEALQGRKLNERAIAAGTHSHDGGASWHKGH